MHATPLHLRIRLERCRVDLRSGPATASVAAELHAVRREAERLGMAGVAAAAAGTLAGAVDPSDG